MKTIVLVEDDDRLSQLIGDFLRQEGFDVVARADGTDLNRVVSEQNAALVILDVMLPGKDGFTLCKELRREYLGPILFMTAKGGDLEQIIGLEMGADDYVVKPVEPRVLLARVNALLRRIESKDKNKPASVAKMVFGQLRMDREARTVMLADQGVELTSHEFDMLWMLASHAGEVVSRNHIYQSLIGREYDGLDRSADVRISRLRKKLFDNPKNPQRIKTIWGKGFFFVADAWDTPGE